MSTRRKAAPAVQSDAQAPGEDTSASRADASAPPPSAPQVEVELKLAIDQGDLARIGRHPLIRSAAIGRTLSRRLHSIYYDTPDCHLQRAGIALRLRKEGARWVQTLKGGGRVEGGLHQREEVESRVSGPFLDQAMLDARLDAELADPAIRSTLQPRFVTEFRRQLRVLEPAAGTRIEMCVDEGSISTAQRSVRLHEVELELKAGSPLTLLDFADALIQSLPLRLEPASKAQRGYALAADAQPQPVRAGAIELDGGLGVTQAWRRIVFACIAQLQANERGAMAGEDAEYIHQARVALRRLRSAFNVFDSAFPRHTMAPLIEEIRWLDRALGPARDWDVFVLETLPPLQAGFPDHAGLRALAERAAQLRIQANAIAGDALRSARYTRLLLQMIALFHRQPWLADTAPEAAAARDMALEAFAADVLAQRHRKVRKRGRDVDQMDHAALHALRIAIKKLRYAAEFFGSLYERKAQRRFVRALTAVQGHLGAVNDAATVEHLCRQLSAPDAEAREAIGLLRGWAAARSAGHIEQFAPAWKDLRGADAFWE